jgi:hybrid cluster-associated redox disulfide protein
VIDKKMIIADVLKKDQKSAAVFFEMGMFCVGCPSASGESIEDACKVHGINADELVDKLNAFFAGV